MTDPTNHRHHPTPWGPIFGTILGTIVVLAVLFGLLFQVSQTSRFAAIANARIDKAFAEHDKLYRELHSAIARNDADNAANRRLLDAIARKVGAR